MTTIAAPRKGQLHRAPTDTEEAAAHAVTNITGKLRVQAYLLLKAHRGGLTDDEGGHLMGGDRLTFGRRRQELVKEGLVKDSGIRRQKDNGRSAIVWSLI